MSAAGNYNTRLRRQVASTTGAGNTYTYANGSYYWCEVKDLSANEVLAYGALQSQANVRIRVRNLPVLNFIDRLLNETTNDLYIITGINKEENELVVTAYRGSL